MLTINTPTTDEQYRARLKFAEYRTLEKAGRSTAADRVAQEVYRQVGRGRTLLSLQQALRAAGVDPRGRPKLAIARADARWCFFNRVADFSRNADGSGVAMSEFHGSTLQHATNRPWRRSHGRGLSVLVSRDLFPIAMNEQIRAQVPSIPPAIRPAGDLKRFHILWEADWQVPPKDPLLLQRVSTDWFVVLAQWDLTEIERSILAASSHAEAY